MTKKDDLNRINQILEYIKYNILDVELVEDFLSYIYDFKFKNNNLGFSFFYSGKFYGFYFLENKHVPYTSEDILEIKGIPMEIKKIIIFNMDIFK